MSAAETDRRGRILLRLARESLEREFRPHLAPAPTERSADEPWLLEPGAVFVTLKREGQLRGCVGSLGASRALLDDVRHNAVSAARNDHRFPPMAAEELDGLEIEVSWLSPPEAMRFSGEAEALAQLRTGIDGVVLSWGARRATFLPQVWESLPEPEDFLARLKQKAGLRSEFWDPEIELERYTVRRWRESAS